MNKLYSLFLILFSLHFFSQSTQAKITIDKNINATASINNLKEKEKRLLALKTQSEKLHYISGILQAGDGLMIIYGDQSRYKEEELLGRQLIEVAKNITDTDGNISNIYRKLGLVLGYGYANKISSIS